MKTTCCSSHEALTAVSASDGAKLDAALVAGNGART